MSTPVTYLPDSDWNLCSMGHGTLKTLVTQTNITTHTHTHTHIHTLTLTHKQSVTPSQTLTQTHVLCHPDTLTHTVVSTLSLCHCQLHVVSSDVLHRKAEAGCEMCQLTSLIYPCLTGWGWLASRTPVTWSLFTVGTPHLSRNRAREMLTAH